MRGPGGTGPFCCPGAGAEAPVRAGSVYGLPDGAVQLYLRDPAGNMVEVNWPDASTLDRSGVGEIEEIPAAEGQKPTLYQRR